MVMTVLDKIDIATKANPQKIAFRSRSGHISYAMLRERSDRLASRIESEMGEDKGPVIVYGHKSPLMPVCFLACLKSGRAYCPVDSSMPPERIKEIVSVIGDPLILATEPLSQEMGYIMDAETMEAAFTLCEAISEEARVKAQDLFYLIFTSGSTGKPKGVQISDENLYAFTEWSKGLFQSGGNVLNQAPFSFDLSVMDTYTALTMGETIVSLDRELQQDMKAMLEYIRENRVENFVSTPSFVSMLLAEPMFDSQSVYPVRRFVFCGEKLSKEIVSRLRERFSEAEIINTYGPTETTVAVSGVTITEQMLKDEKPLPIGVARPGMDIFVERGELLIAGDSVSSGYFKDQEKTDEVFSDLYDGRRCYRSGDCGFYEDGLLYCTGRKDFQIKWHGYRIELEDIENNLLELEPVAEAAVIPRYEGDTIRNLVAFVVTKIPVNGRELRKQLKERLPVYMVPKKIQVIDQMPMSANGKVDRKKLEERL